MTSTAANKRKKSSPKTSNAKHPKSKRLQTLQEPTSNTPFKSGSMSRLSKQLSLSFEELNSDSSSKRKLAPRSSLQFKIGPQFTETIISVPILDSTNQYVKPKICPRIDRGFELIEGDWIGYKRNYFTLVSSFFFENVGFELFAGEEYHIIDPDSNQLVRIKYFAIQLVSRCADEDSFTHINLIQHTAKRDRGPQFPPAIHPVIPSELPHHDIIREAANVRNIGKILKMDSIFHFDKKHHSDINFSIDGLRDYPHEKIFKVARYERVQFSSHINYKKPSLKHKRFKLFVELVGYTENEEFVKLAYTETPPLIVRGRSPSNYSQESTATTTGKVPKTSRRKKKPNVSKPKLNGKFSEFEYDDIQVDNFELDKIDLELQNLLTYPIGNELENIVTKEDDLHSKSFDIIRDQNENIDLSHVDFSNFPLDDLETLNILSLANKNLNSPDDSLDSTEKKRKTRKVNININEKLGITNNPDPDSIGIRVNEKTPCAKRAKILVKSGKITSINAPLSEIFLKDDTKKFISLETHNILHEIMNTHQNNNSSNQGDSWKFESLNRNHFASNDVYRFKEIEDENQNQNAGELLDHEVANCSQLSNYEILQIFDKSVSGSFSISQAISANHATNDDANLSHIFPTVAISDITQEEELLMIMDHSHIKNSHSSSFCTLQIVNPSDVLGTYDDDSGFLGMSNDVAVFGE